MGRTQAGGTGGAGRGARAAAGVVGNAERRETLTNKDYALIDDAIATIALQPCSVVSENELSDMTRIGRGVAPHPRREIRRAGRSADAVDRRSRPARTHASPAR